MGQNVVLDVGYRDEELMVIFFFFPLILKAAGQ